MAPLLNKKHRTPAEIISLEVSPAIEKYSFDLVNANSGEFIDKISARLTEIGRYEIFVGAPLVENRIGYVRRQVMSNGNYGWLAHVSDEIGTTAPVSGMSKAAEQLVAKWYQDAILPLLREKAVTGEDGVSAPRA